MRAKRMPKPMPRWRGSHTNLPLVVLDTSRPRRGRRWSARSSLSRGRRRFNDVLWRYPVYGHRPSGPHEKTIGWESTGVAWPSWRRPSPPTLSQLLLLQPPVLTRRLLSASGLPPPQPPRADGSLTPFTWANKHEKLERTNSGFFFLEWTETGFLTHVPNSCKRLIPSRLHELHDSKLPFVSLIEFIRSKLSV